MIITIDQLRQIVGAGGGLVLNGSSFTVSQLKLIVAEAASQPVTITIKNIDNITHEHMNLLSGLAPGKLIFDFT